MAVHIAVVDKVSTVEVVGYSQEEGDLVDTVRILVLLEDKDQKEDRQDCKVVDNSSF